MPLFSPLILSFLVLYLTIPRSLVLAQLLSGPNTANFSADSSIILYSSVLWKESAAPDDPALKVFCSDSFNATATFIFFGELQPAHDLHHMDA